MARRRKPAAIVVSVLAGCTSARPIVPEQNQVDPARDGPAVEAVRALARDALHHDRYARQVLYTWTTLEQIQELQDPKKSLLSRDESPAHGSSYVDQILFVLANLGDPVAKVLYTEPFAKMRFAWHAPWATRAGWPTEKYGEYPIRVTLKADAIIVAVSTAKGVTNAKNLLNENVPLAQVVARPEKIGAIYFTSELGADVRPGFPKPTATFREFALCNESMIESWEVGTPAILARIREDQALLAHVAKYAEGLPTVPAIDPAAAWAHPVPTPSPETAFAAALALVNGYYTIDEKHLRDIRAQLQAPATSTAIARTGAATFTPGNARKAPRVVKSYNPTYASFARPPHPTAAKP